MKIKPGTDLSNHACLIPHLQRPGNSAINRNCVFIQLNDGRYLEMPSNFYHYVDPDAHKNYARFMPNRDLIQWALQSELQFIDYTDTKVDDAQRYGYVSYVKKNGFLDCGISEPSDRRKGCEFHYPHRAGQLVLTHAHDAALTDEVPHVQKEEYRELCKEVSSRFGFQMWIYALLESKIETKTPISIDQGKLAQFQKAVVGFLINGGEYSELLSASNALNRGEVGQFQLARPVETSFEFNLDERRVVVAMLYSKYFKLFELNEETLTVHFEDPAEMVLAQQACYEKECLSGYQNPIFERTQALAHIDPSHSSGSREYDSDDDLKGQGACCIM